MRAEELEQAGVAASSGPPTRIPVVLADDHPAIIDGLQELFSSQPDILVVAVCRTGEQALAALRLYPASVLVLDLRMPGTHGLEVLRGIRDANLPTRVVVFTAALDDDEMVAALRLGARGLVLKEMSPSLLLQSIRTVYAGGRWLERQFSLRAVDRLLRRETGMRRVVEVLSPVEIDTVRAVARGARNERIADQLHVSEDALRVHLHHIYEKLGVRSRPALVRFAHDHALI